MNTRSLLMLAVFLAAVSPALAGLTIPVGTHYLFPGEQQIVFFDVDGGDAVAGMDFCIQLGDGGPDNGGTDAMPKIAAVSLTAPGTLFASNPYGLTLKKPDPAAPAKIWWIEVQSQPTTTVPAQGTMARVTIDTATTSVGQQFELLLKDVWPTVWGTDLYTSFLSNAPPYQVEPTTTNGWIVISNLHTMSWTGSGSGNWGNNTWGDNATFPPPYDQPPLGPPPAPTYPNHTANVVINPADVAKTVTIDAGHASRAAHSLTLAGKGRLTIEPGKTLAVTENVTISDEGQLTLQSSGGIGAGLSAATINLSGGVLWLTPQSSLTATAIGLGGGTLSGAGTIAAPITATAGTLATPNSGDTLALSGGLALNSTVGKSGSGTVILSGNYNHGGTLNVAAGTWEYQLAADKTVDIGPAARLSIAADATVVLGGNKAALSDGEDYVDITNDSNAAGLRVLDGLQAVGAIDGAGTTTIAAGAELTASYVRQQAVILQGEAGQPAKLIIRPSGSSGGLRLAPGSLGTAASSAGASQSVPEPGTLLLLVMLAALGLACRALRRR